MFSANYPSSAYEIILDKVCFRKAYAGWIPMELIKVHQRYHVDICQSLFSLFNQEIGDFRRKQSQNRKAGPIILSQDLKGSVWSGNIRISDAENIQDENLSLMRYKGAYTYSVTEKVMFTIVGYNNMLTNKRKAATHTNCRGLLPVQGLMSMTMLTNLRQLTPLKISKNCISRCWNLLYTELALYDYHILDHSNNLIILIIILSIYYRHNQPRTFVSDGLNNFGDCQRKFIKKYEIVEKLYNNCSNPVLF